MKRYEKSVQENHPKAWYHWSKGVKGVMKKYKERVHKKILGICGV